jgi:N6-adenosine-specific RNA methylase IME4
MTKKYQIIYSDPPWSYQASQFNNTDNSKTSTGAEAHYKTMKTKELKQTFTKRIKEICDQDCLLFMWTSSPHLEEALELGVHWGFKYITVAFVWHKQKPNVGYYTMSECELCLLFKKGKIPTPRGSRNTRQFLSELRREHSRKPDEIRNRITSMFPTQNKLEMFARNNTKGWDVFGHETDKF